MEDIAATSVNVVAVIDNHISSFYQHIYTRFIEVKPTQPGSHSIWFSFLYCFQLQATI